MQIIDFDLQKQFKAKTSEQISIEAEGHNRFKIFTPFMFGDGDHLDITLKKEQNRWILTDEGDTLMHLNIFGIDLKYLLYGTRKRILSEILQEFSVKNIADELIFEIEDDDFGIALYKFAQALLKISDLIYLSQEKIKKTFVEDFKNLIAEAVSMERCTFGWHDPERDLQLIYSVDCKINSMKKPLMIFALQNEEKTLRSIITINQLEKWRIPCFPIGIYEDETKISSKTVARFGDVCEKTYSNIKEENHSRIVNYLKECTAIN